MMCMGAFVCVCWVGGRAGIGLADPGVLLSIGDRGHETLRNNVGILGFILDSYCVFKSNTSFLHVYF